ncbi:MAG: carboxypeptidase regulatory-like domain-containing protein [Bacteroidales bacterium]|nr:carboxypeptidase regulatory-like domain-containing protein [Bacteroidales bacterium]
MKKYFFVFIMLTFTLTSFSQEKVIIRFSNPDPILVKHFATNNYDIAAYSPTVFLDLVVTEEEYNSLLAQGYVATVIQTEAGMRANLRGDADLPGYRSYQESLAELQQMQIDHPEICKLFDLGDSRGKEYYLAGNNNYVNYQHDIWALKVSDNVELDEDEPAIYYMGAHHAREPLSTEVAFYVLNHILDNYGTNPSITENVNSKEIWFIPVVNPDGQKIVLDQIDVNWRKNIRDNDNNGQVTLSGGWSYPDGVDPNRNYGWQFGGQGASSDPGELTYHGPSAFSEPEIAAMRDLMADHHFVAGITYHTYSELVLWPYGYLDGATAPDATALAALGTAMGQSIPKLGSGNYTPQPSWALYPSSGTTDDYAYGNHGIFSYTIELATQFIPPANQVLGICQDNLQAALILLNRVNTSTLTGLVTNSVTGEPVVAEVYVQGIDNTGLYREPYRSNEAFGRYYRLLPNGNYTVTFSAFGYISQTFNNVNINSQGQTELNVSMVQSQIITVTGTVTDSDTGEPIANASVEVLGTPIDPVYTNNNGEYTIDEIFENTYSFKVWAENYATLIQQVTVSPQNTVANFELTETNAVSFEAGVFPTGWTFSGNANWTITSAVSWDGQYSARSGAIGNDQTSQMIYTMEAASAGEISFYRKVSSEADYDYLRFYINNVQKGQWSGEVAWSEVSFPVTAGMNTFKWVYEKDVFVVSGQDAAWIDYIIFPPSPTVNANAGPNGQICSNETFTCQGDASFYTSVQWTTAGDGTFSNASILTPVYTPGTNDILNGSVVLTLTAFDGTNSSSDGLTLTIDQLPANGTQINGVAEVCAGSIEMYSCQQIAHADEYEWTLTPAEAGVIQTQNNNEVIVVWADGYTNTAVLQVRGLNDCGYGAYSDEFIVTVNDCTGLNEMTTPGFSLLPNPAEDHITIALSDLFSGNLNIRIYSISGTLQHEQNTPASSDFKLAIELHGMQSGVYFVVITDGNDRAIEKLVIK